MKKGSAAKDGLIIFALLFALLILWFIVSAYLGGEERGRFFGSVSVGNLVPTTTERDRTTPSRRASKIGEYKPEESGETIVINGETYLKSPFYGQVTIGRGNASREYQPREEYITLTAHRRNPAGINITGWILENGAGRKLQRVSAGTFRQGMAGRVAIPEGAPLIFTGQNPTLSAIILPPRGRAIVTTGSLPNFTGLSNVSFQINQCSGYLENVSSYNFNPRLSRSCPRANVGPGAESLENNCFTYLSRLSRCKIPETEPVVIREGRESYVLNNHLDRRTDLSPQCRVYALDYLNYNGCVRHHFTDDNFFTGDWRIYLNQTFQLWDSSREVITLYDNYGRLVDQIKY